MKSSIKFNIITAIGPLALGAMVLFGCSKGSNNSYEVYGPVDSLAATFTVSPVPGNDTKFVITNTTQGEFVGTRWDVGKDTSGNSAAMGKTTDTVFYPQAGTYTIKMWALNKRGKLFSATPVKVTTTKNDPAFDNVIKGGKMNAGDDQYWKIFDATANKINWTLANNVYSGKVTLPVTVQANGGIYQAVQVVANKKYRFDMNATYDAPNLAWLEVYIGALEPVNTKDYTEGGKRLGFITWNNWVGFSGTKGFDITFGASGTYYVVIKAGCNTGGGSFGNTGFNVTNIDLHRTQE